mmetsp:Transcript_7432/g.10543  ORF Transcript_7432/g.10543 Transcript_7432/m.10543 type:complete len:83 (+) Transcript_7432:2428-2676(+)
MNRIPATEQLFQIDEESEKLDAQQLSDFHSKVATLLYLTKRVRPDCLCATIFLTSRVLCATWSATQASRCKLSSMRALPSTS